MNLDGTHQKDRKTALTTKETRLWHQVDKNYISNVEKYYQQKNVANMTATTA